MSTYSVLFGEGYVAYKSMPPMPVLVREHFVNGVSPLFVIVTNHYLLYSSNEKTNISKTTI